MKKTIAISTILLIALSSFLMFTLQTKAQSDYQLTTNPYADTEPSWSSDGQKIVYHVYAGSWYRHIWVMNNDGSNKNQLTSGNVVDVGPAYSPDGTKIAFSRYGFRGDYFDLMIMDADGSNVERITYNGIPGKSQGSYEAVRWSSDGSKLLFHYNEGTTAPPYYSWWIGTINVDGSDLSVLGSGQEPKFCHGDSKILFNTDEYSYEDGRCIALMNADGSGMQILTDGPMDFLPDMSLITNRVVFTRYADLYIMNEDGTAIEHFTSGSYAEWSPDEKYIVYMSEKSGNGDIWKMEAPQVSEEVTAILDIDPDSLNLRSQGIWITAYIELPENLGVSEINISTIRLNDTIPVDPDAPWELGDYDEDGSADLMVKFDRNEVAEYLLDVLGVPAKFTWVTLTVTGELNDDTAFEGYDVIKAIYPRSLSGKRLFIK